MDQRVKKLLNWYRKHKRDLPWRKTRDAYRIFMSELMLQQTQVDRVIPRYLDWIKTFRSWNDLSKASTQELVHAWAGLGYNRRALYARDAARDVVKHGVPSDEGDWRKLKGVGPYMAAALTEFVNHARAIVIDTNVRRVAGRVLLGLPYPKPQDDGRIIATLERVTPQRGAHWELPQAFMDLANTNCRAHIPECATCPLRDICRARRLFTPQRFASTLLKKQTSKPHERRHQEKKYPDRIYRGRILAWIRTHGPTKLAALGPHIDETHDPIADQDWIRAMTSRLVKDGLLAQGRRDTIILPKS
jgi:A/G-specific adenine glycosylase